MTEKKTNVKFLHHSLFCLIFTPIQWQGRIFSPAIKWNRSYDSTKLSAKCCTTKLPIVIILPYPMRKEQTEGGGFSKSFVNYRYCLLFLTNKSIRNKCKLWIISKHLIIILGNTCTRIFHLTLKDATPRLLAHTNVSQRVEYN